MDTSTPKRFLHYIVTMDSNHPEKEALAETNKPETTSARKLTPEVSSDTTPEGAPEKTDVATTDEPTKNPKEDGENTNYPNGFSLAAIFFGLFLTVLCTGLVSMATPPSIIADCSCR